MISQSNPKMHILFLFEPIIAISIPQGNYEGLMGKPRQHAEKMYEVTLLSADHSSNRDVVS